MTLEPKTFGFCSPLETNTVRGAFCRRTVTGVAVTDDYADKPLVSSCSGCSSAGQMENGRGSVETGLRVRVSLRCGRLAWSLAVGRPGDVLTSPEEHPERQR